MYGGVKNDVLCIQLHTDEFFFGLTPKTLWNAAYEFTEKTASLIGSIKNLKLHVKSSYVPFGSGNRIYFLNNQHRQALHE